MNRPRPHVWIILIAACGAISGGNATLAAPAETAARDLIRETRAAQIGYRLAMAANGLCKRPRAITGMILHDVAGYSQRDRPAIDNVFGLGRGFGVRAVVADSGAARAGIRAGDVIVRLDDIDLERFAPELIRGDASAERSTRVAALIEDRGRDAAPVRLTVRRSGALIDVALAAQRGCGGRVVVAQDDTVNAWSDGEAVAVTARLVDLAADDDELAFAIAHEMAHNLLGHGTPSRRGAGFADAARERSSSAREREFDADALGARIAATAGYAPQDAEALLERVARARGPSLSLSHPGIAARIARLRAITPDLLARLGRTPG
jgi:hypothetical protein